MSLRDELLKVGLINKKQADDAERKLQRRERQPRQTDAPPRQAGAPLPAGTPPGTDAHRPPSAPLPKVDPSHRAAAAKLARDMEMNRKLQEKAEKKARSAQIAQIIKEHRLPLVEGESYNFLDGAKIRRIGVDAPLRAGLVSASLVIVRHEGRYEVIPAPVAQRLRERDPAIFIATAAAAEKPPDEDAYAQFPIPDDLQW